MTDRRRPRRQQRRSSRRGPGQDVRPGRRRCDGVDLELYPGEVLAVIGDNGAGKSTLIKCLSGAMIPDAGEIKRRRPAGALPATAGRPRGRHRDRLPDPRCRAGAGHREQPLPRPRDPPAGVRSGSVLRMLDTRRDAARTPRSRSTDLGIAHAAEHRPGRSRRCPVASGRPWRWPAPAAFGSKVVILDEPTAALGVRETGQVLRLVRDLRDRGLAVILISHNMPQRLRDRRPDPHPAARAVRWA